MLAEYDYDNHKRDNVDRKSQLKPGFGVHIKTIKKTYINSYVQITNTVGNVVSDDGKKTAPLAATMFV